MSASGTEIKVALIEDQRDVREGLTILINGSSGFRCVAAFRSMEEALRQLERAPLDDNLPDVLLTDIGLPGMSGVEGIRILKQWYPEMPIVALTIYDDDDNVFDALCAGASGYLLKNTPPARLLESVREVASGGAPMSPEVARRVVNLFREFRPPARDNCRLTSQETELLKLIIEGHSYKTAADRLAISISTVSFHLQNIYPRTPGPFEVRSRRQGPPQQARLTNSA
jgi:DNA-binding NarL/FixJ family response regulator